MAYTNPRGLPNASDIGRTITTICQYTLADYTAAGTTDPAVGDVVRFSGTGNWLVAIAADDTTSGFGRVTRVTNKISGTATGEVEVEWLDIIGFRVINVTDLSTLTLGDSAIKAGDTTHKEDWDAAATTGNLVVVSKSGTTGAGTAVCALVCR